MEAAEHEQSVAIDSEMNHVWKTPHDRAADVLENSWKLQGALSDPLHRGIDLEAKASGQSSGLAFMPILRVDQFCARHLSKDNRENYGRRRSSAAFSAAQAAPWPRSWSSEARRFSSSVRCAAVKGN